MLSDILPTGFECGVLNGKARVGGSVAIVGSGPIGPAPLLTAQFYSPSQIIMIDLDDNRLSVSQRFGATEIVNSSDGKAAEHVMKQTGGRGVDTAIEAVGIQATFELCQDIVAPGGTIANVGVHGMLEVRADVIAATALLPATIILVQRAGRHRHAGGYGLGPSARPRTRTARVPSGHRPQWVFRSAAP